MNSFFKIFSAVYVSCLLLISINLKSQDISYSNEINFPNSSEELGASRDIMIADNYIYIYTLDGILVYDRATKNYQAKIDFGVDYGRFAPMYFDHTLYAPDPKFMAFDPTGHVLYFVTDDLSINYVNTDSEVLDITPKPIDVDLTMDIENKTNHAYSKIEYDIANDRLYFLTRTMKSNFHSFDSYFVALRKEGNNWTPIHQESVNGSNNNLQLLSTYTYSNNTTNPKVYLARKYKIEEWGDDASGDLTLFNIVDTEGQERNGKLLYIRSHDLLMVFPLTIGTTTVPGTQYIYQINTNTFNVVDKSLSPSMKVLDASASQDNNEVFVCYGMDGFVQNDGNSDVSIYSYSNGKFVLTQSVNTNESNETDIYSWNLNRPFRLTCGQSNTVFVSKKNEIVKLEYNDGVGYEVSNIIYSKDNYYHKGIYNFNNETNTGKLLTLNFASSGFNEFVFGLINQQNFYRTSFPINNSIGVNRNILFFNRLSTENTGLFVYNMDTEAQTFLPMSNAIGDIVYNPYQKHVLISQYKEDENIIKEGPIIKVYDEDLNYIKTIKEPGTDFAMRMYVAPNERIYISLNMRNDEDMPKILVLDANDYHKIGLIDTELEDNPMNCSSFQAFFDYNYLENNVYAGIGPYDNIKPPYHTSSNCSQSTYNFPFESPEPNVYEGKLIRIMDDLTTESFDIPQISEIKVSIDESQTLDPGYKGAVYINSHNMLDRFDCGNNTITNIMNNFPIYDIEYVQLKNKLYVYYQEKIIKDNEPNINNVHIYSVHEDGSYNEIWTKSGIAASISYNKFDGKLYVYYLGETNMLGSSVSKIYTLDTNIDEPQTPEEVDLPIRNFFPIIMPQANYPYFDAYNKAYFPNGVHSSVSVINFEGNEPLPLYFSKENDGTVVEWVSIPRMPSNTSSDYEDQQGSLVKDIFDRNNFAVPYTYLRNDYHDAEYNFDEYNKWDIDSWEHHFEQSTWSYRGYIMDLNSDEDNFIYMTGNIKDPATTFPLYPQQTNWVGYFLTQEQDIFDAIGASALSLLNRIEHQDYFCVKGIAPFGPTHGVGNVATWVCEKQQTNIKYGEMVKLHSISETGLDKDLIQWQNPGNLPRKKIRPELEHFSYEETANYTPLIIELDYEVNPQELAAYINEVCVGATSVMPEDTVVFMRAYLEGIEIDSIEFRDWYSTKSSLKNSIKEYSVYNKNLGRYENRALMSNTKDDVVRISFKTEDLKKPNNRSDYNVNIWPNPATNQLNYSVYAEENGTMNISVFDLNGRFLKIITDKKVNSGFNVGNANIEDVKKGIYLIKIRIDNNTIIKKLVIN